MFLDRRSRGIEYRGTRYRGVSKKVTHTPCAHKSSPAVNERPTSRRDPAVEFQTASTWRALDISFFIHVDGYKPVST